MKLFSVLYYIFFGVVAVIGLLLVVSTFPITGNYKFFVVQSGSMEPAISTGSIVMVAPKESYKIGDVITFKNLANAKAPITHRVADMRVDKGNPLYITKGDANNASDAREIVHAEVMGKVLFHVPYVGYGVAVAKTPYGFAALIIIPAAIIIADETKKIWREIKAMRKKQPHDESTPA